VQRTLLFIRTQADRGLTPRIGALALALVGSETQRQVPATAGTVVHIAQPDGRAGQWLSIDREAGDFCAGEGGSGSLGGLVKCCTL